ncbi:putative nuclease HARBI1 [Cydia splendana]|uniref:putative nuclease HARBI1 n=1 Tax=Cydia splendana TaxID=1100963 RepID=UPI00300C62D4
MAARLLLLQEALAEEKRQEAARRRLMRERFRQINVPDAEFVNTFRVTREVFETLYTEVGPLLPPVRNNRGIDPVDKILIALKFFGRGDYQGGVGRDQWVPMSQQAVSDCLRDVTTALNDPGLIHRHMIFPNTQAARAVIKNGFYEKFGIPGVCGAIDCTHVALHRPHEYEERFFNRKHFHSLNVQMVCDHENYILNVDASYGGATHDAFIWANSVIRNHFEQLCGTGEIAYLLGDSGYPLREYLMTPVDGAAEDSPEGRYNDVQKRARSIIERTFGILKGRWRCLLAARELYYRPDMVGKIVVACSVLHNMCTMARLEPLELEPDEIAAEEDLQRNARAVYQPPPAVEALRRGREAREKLVANGQRFRYVIQIIQAAPGSPHHAVIAIEPSPSLQNILFDIPEQVVENEEPPLDFNALINESGLLDDVGDPI